MIVTIDGPAGAGKSTVARRLAERLGFDFLDTGAMYRAVTLAALRAGTPAEEGPALTSTLEGLTIVVAAGRTTLNGADVSAEIRKAEVAAAVSAFAALAPVRSFLTEQQRAIGACRNLVAEGRDQGTVVFPHAEFKFFLTADDVERARRRQADFAKQGRHATVEEILAEQRKRDALDQDRALAPLRPAPDAILVDTTTLDVAGVLDLMEARVRIGKREAGSGDREGL